MRVYLGGTVTKDATHLNWRTVTARYLREQGIEPVDPIRFQNPTNFSENGLEDSTTPGSFLVDVDLHDVRTSDVLLIYYQRDKNTPYGYMRQSIGTWTEWGVAIERRIPVVVVTDDPEVANHPFIQRHAAIVTEHLSGGLGWILRMR